MKRKFAVLYFIGVLSLAYSVTMLPPIAVSLWFHDGEWIDFANSFLILAITGLLFWALFRGYTHDLHRRDGFLIVAIFWTLISAVSALPFVLGDAHLDMVDALFEATSGFTTTGATIITDLDQVPPSVLYYRQQLQWFGGLGLIVIAIAIVPILGVGGSQLYKAETPGPMKEEKLAPRLVQTTHFLCVIYVLLTVLCMLAYWVAGMPFLEALEHSFSTVSTGGFSTHDSSIGFYKNEAIYLIAVVFMLLGAINFGVHFAVFHKGNVSRYWQDPETRAYIFIISGIVLLCTAILFFTRFYDNFGTSLLYSLFEVTSVITSTGLGITDFSTWPVFLPLLLIFISFVGGCGGSTAGGMKVMRVMVFFKQLAHEVFSTIYPKSIRPLRVGMRVLDEKTMQSIWGFISIYVVVYIVLTLCLLAAGLDQVTAFSAVAATINNLGPGLGEVSATFASVNDATKLVGVAAMLLGRLEIFTLLIILLPAYWKN